MITGGKRDIGAYAFSHVTPGSLKQPVGNNDNKTRNSRPSNNLLGLLSLSLLETYRRSNFKFEYSPSFNPRRVLTHPSEGVSNQLYDNCNADYIIYVNDIIGTGPNHRYQVVDLLGQGTFGQVVKCRNCDNDEITALKILKNKPAYLNQGLVEVRILELLNSHYDPDNKHHTVRLVDYFIFRRHLCLVFELLSVNLYELIKQNHFRGLSTKLIRVFMIQILDALVVLSQANIIHCDLKPENILLQMLNSPSIKLIDFGSACFESQTVYSYIQSRHYRSPEVLIGTKYTAAIDMWSLGCIAAELFLGLPLFPGTSEYNQLSRIIEMQGYPSDEMLDAGKQTQKFFEAVPNPQPGGQRYVLKSEGVYAQESGAPVQQSKRYFNYTKLEDLIQNYGLRKNSNPAEVESERTNRLSFCDFVSGLVKMDSRDRWTPLQAKEHPFITGGPFTGPFIPNPVLKKPPPIKSIPPRLPLNPASPFHPMSAPAAPSSMFPPQHPAVSTPKKPMYKPGLPEYAATPDSYSPRGYFTHAMQQQGNIALGASPSVSHFPPSPYSSVPYNPYHPPMGIAASPSYSAWPEAGGPYPPNYTTHPHQPNNPPHHQQPSNNPPHHQQPSNNPNRRARSKSDSKDLPAYVHYDNYRKRGDSSSIPPTPNARGPLIGESPATSHFMYPGSLTSPRDKGSASTTPSTSGSFGRGTRHEQSAHHRLRSRSFGNDTTIHQSHSPRRPQQQQQQSHQQLQQPHQHQQAQHPPQSQPQTAVTSPERFYSRSPSDDDPSNWDPNYSDEQLLSGYDATATPPKRPSPQQPPPQHSQQPPQQQQQQHYPPSQSQQPQQKQQFSSWAPPAAASSEDQNALYTNFSNLYIDPRRGPVTASTTINTPNAATTNNNTNNNNTNNSSSSTSSVTMGSSSVASSWVQSSWTMPTMAPESYGSYDTRGDSSLLGFSPYTTGDPGRMHGHQQYSHSPPTSASSSASSSSAGFASYMQQQQLGGINVKQGRSPPKSIDTHKNSRRSNNNNANTTTNSSNNNNSNTTSSKQPSPSHPIHTSYHAHHNKQLHPPQQQQQQSQQQQSQHQPYPHSQLRTPTKPPNVIFSSPGTPQPTTPTPALPKAQSYFGGANTPSQSHAHAHGHLSTFMDKSSSLPKSPDATSSSDDRNERNQDVFTHLFVSDIDDNEEQRNDTTTSSAVQKRLFGTSSAT